MLEHVVIGGQGGRGENGAEDGVGRVVERVGGDEGAAVNVSGKNELNFRGPLLDGFRFRLRSLVVLLEVVGEVAVQVEASGIVSENKDNRLI